LRELHQFLRFLRVIWRQNGPIESLIGPRASSVKDSFNAIIGLNYQETKW
jgi:hypothetical protein